MGRFDGKVAMVTGCGGEVGFGRAIARHLAAEGADLVLTDIAPTGMKVVPTKPASGWGGLEAVAGEVRQAGRRAMTGLMDVRSARQVDAVVAETIKTFGRIDILVNNAAAPPGPDRVPVVELPEEVWDQLLSTNLKGTYLCAKVVAATMVRGQVRGRIINMGSDCGRRGVANMAAYCASKFGVIGFTQALALELAPAGITVNALGPGPADTDRLDYLGRRPDGSFDPTLRASGIQRRGGEVPMGRLAAPGDVAELAAFLASDGAGYITGQAINVSGGLILH